MVIMKNGMSFPEIQLYFVFVSFSLIYLISAFYLIILTKPMVHLGNITFNTDFAIYFNVFFLLITVVVLIFIFEKRIRIFLSL